MLLFECVSSFDTAKLNEELKSMSMEIVECLPDMYDKNGLTLLNKAAYENNHRILDLLLLVFKQRLT